MEREEKKVSVVIPVFNGEKFLSRQVESILAQEYSRIEILLIDDGSTDGSLDICRRYEEEDTRIRVIHQENGGESRARNTGLRNVSGEYVMVVDQDDQLAPGMFQDMMRYANDFCPDVIRCNFVSVHSAGEKKVCVKRPCGVVLERSCIVDEIIPYMIGIKLDEEKKVQGHWTAMYSTALVRKYDLHYEESLLKENDHRYLVDVMARAKSLVLVEGAYYRFIKRKGSNTSSYSPRFDNHLSNEAHYKDLFANEYDFHAQQKLRYNIEFFLKDCIVYYCVHYKDCNVRKEISKMLTCEQVVSWLTEVEPYDDFTREMQKYILEGNFNHAVLLAYKFYFQYRFNNLKRKIIRGRV